MPERIDVLHAPELLPKPRYVGDHHGPRRDLDEAARARWAALLARAEVAFEIDWEQPGNLLTRAPSLRWVQCTSSGVGPMLVRMGLAGSPLIVTNAAGIHAQPLAEFVLMAMLHFAKDMPRLSAWKAERHWERFCGMQLHGTRMLLIGLGKVGARIAESSAALGVEVVGHRRSVGGTRPPGVTRLVGADQLDEELARADWLVLAAPDSPDTRNMIDARRLTQLPSQAVIINVGRGSLVDEAAMISLLATRRLRGAALDVFAQEPLPTDSPLWELPNVIISPHSASTVAAENDLLVDLFIENLKRYLAGEPLINVFDHGNLVPASR
jgi:glyoxylate/hydroxypyruvate reductase